MQHARSIVMKDYCKIPSIIFLTFSTLISCGNALDKYYENIRKMKFIPWESPRDDASTGTIFYGENMEDLMVEFPADVCFPKNDTAYPLRYSTNIEIAQRIKENKISAKGFLQFFTALAAGSPSITAGAEIESVKSIKFSVKGAKREYIPLGLLDHWLTGNFPGQDLGIARLCRSSLTDYEGMSFVIEALNVSSMQFEFYNKHNGKISLSEENISNFLSFDFNLSWNIINGTILSFETPKYIALRLAQIAKVSNHGIDYLISKHTDKHGAFVFYPLQRHRRRSGSNALTSHQKIFSHSKELSKFEFQSLDLSPLDEPMDDLKLFDFDTDSKE